MPNRITEPLMLVLHLRQSGYTANVSSLFNLYGFTLQNYKKRMVCPTIIQISSVPH